MSEWSEYTVGEIVKLEHGKGLKDYRDLDSGYDVFGTNGKIGKTEKFLHDKPSVVIGRKGAYREVNFAKNPFFVIDTAFYTKNLIDDLDTTFLYYWFKNVDINAMDSGSAIPSTSRDEVYELEIYLPELPEQTSIAGALSSLDDKIALLCRQNKTLEALAETLFRQWFVEEAEESWEDCKISNVARINQETISKDLRYQNIQYLDTGSITEGNISGFQEFSLAEKPSRAQRVVQDGDIVYSLVRPIQRHYGLLSNLADNAIASTGFCVVSAETRYRYFLYILLTMNETVDYLDMIAEASTSTYPSLKPSDIANFEFSKPPDSKLDRFSEIANNYWNKITTNHTRISTLTQLRDTLLPKLMSGEVRVKM